MVLSCLSLFPHSLDRGIGETPRHNFVIHFKEPKGMRRGGERESIGFKEEESKGKKKLYRKWMVLMKNSTGLGPDALAKLLKQRWLIFKRLAAAWLRLTRRFHTYPYMCVFVHIPPFHSSLFSALSSPPPHGLDLQNVHLGHVLQWLSPSWWRSYDHLSSFPVLGGKGRVLSRPNVPSLWEG